MEWQKIFDFSAILRIKSLYVTQIMNGQIETRLIFNSIRVRSKYFVDFVVL